MAEIYARYNYDDVSLNVLDPDTWIGGVVPGKDDVAIFWYVGINSTYESSKLSLTYGQRDGVGRSALTVFPEQWVYRNNIPWTYTSSKFIPNLLRYRSDEGMATTNFNLNTEASTAAWKAYYQHLGSWYTGYGSIRYKHYAKYFRCNGGSTSITLDGVTYAETDTTTYDTKAKMCARMVELIKAGTLDQNKYTIIGPHNGSGITNNNSHRATTYNGAYFTIRFDTGSEKAPYGTADSLATGWYSGASNITIGDTSPRHRAFRAFFTSSNPGIIYETGSYKYGVGYDYSTGSGYFYLPEWWMYQQGSIGQGVGPGTIGNFKVNFKDMSSFNYIHTASIDTSYATPVTNSMFMEYPCDEIYTDRDTMPAKYKKISPAIVDAPFMLTDKINQRYHLTGSGHWNVGRIEMGDYNHFWVKDDAKITLHDLESGTYYPSIDFADHTSVLSTLLITDQVTIEVSSSRASRPAESGIWARYGGSNVLISGSANYSSSYAPSSSKAGDPTIQISDLSNRFGIGDYVSIESTGSFRIHNPFWKNPSAGTYFESASLTTGSYKEVMYASATPGFASTRNRFSYLNVSESLDINGAYDNYSEFTHNIQNDEIFQIVTASGDYATVAKRYGKEGEINHDMGLYSRTAFMNTFNETPDVYTGTKRVVLVDSNHKEFAKGDQLVINNKAYKVLHAGSHLTQSRFYDFTQGTTKASDVFMLRDSQRSGSNWSYSFGSYGISTNAYFTEQCLRNRCLITGSNEQYIDRFPTAINRSLTSNAYNSSNYSGKRYYNPNNYTALRLDPTTTYTWRQNQHKIYSTHYLAGDYMIKDFLWDEGEIVVSGSLIWHGSGDPTSSVGWDPSNIFGISYGMPQNQSGADYSANGAGNPRSGYQGGSPYFRSVCLSGYYGNPSLVVASSNYCHEIPLGRHGEMQYKAAGSGETARVIYGKLGDTGHADAIGNLDIDHITQNQYTGSAHIKLDINKGIARASVGIKDKETELIKFLDNSGKGGVGIKLAKYGSIHTINIKSRYQMLILDTQDSFTYRDYIKEGGLLENHTPGKKVKYQGTEVTNPMAFTNLVLDAQKNYGSSSIQPYTYAVCRSGTNSDFFYHDLKYGGWRPYAFTNNQTGFQYGQANANYYTIIDLGTEVEFDTIAMTFYHSSYGTEYYTNNKMNDVRFEVTNDPGLTDPWTTVRALEDDVREYSGRPGLRYYTFASGSVSARYVKYHSRGGTRYSSMYTFRHFGVFNMSASCAPGTAPAYNDIRDDYGGPTGSICQIELANTKNYSVGDRIFFQPKFETTDLGWDSYAVYRNIDDTTNGLTDPLPERALTGGGYTGTYKIMNINGNVVTLDKAIHIPMDRPMIALKKNRGNIKLHSRSPNTDFQFNTHTYNLNQLHLSHIDFNDTYMYIAGDQDTFPYQYISDIGLSSRNHGYTNYLGNGNGVFVRNFLCDGNLRYCYSNADTLPNHDSRLYFNIICELGSYSNPPVTSTSKYIDNFCIMNRVITAPLNVYTDNHNFKPRIPKIAIKKNQFINIRYGAEVTRPSALYYRSGTNDYMDRVQYKNFFTDPGWNRTRQYGNITYHGTQLHAFSKKRVQLLPKSMNSFGSTNLNSIMLIGTRYGGDNVGMNRSYMGGFNTVFGREPIFISGKADPAYGGNDHVILGNYYQKVTMVKSGNEYEIYAQGSDRQVKDSSYGESFLTCHFEVFEKTDVRLDLDLIYKTTITRLYGAGSGATSYNYSGTTPDSILLKDEYGKVIDIIHLTSLDYETISHRKIHNLPAGSYMIEFQLGGKYSMNEGYHRLSLKNLDLKLVTNDLSKVKIYQSNFNILDFFDANKHKHVANADNTSTQAGGKFKVLKQSSDLGGTTNYKFNKIKL